mgnify:FL=1
MNFYFFDFLVTFRQNEFRVLAEPSIELLDYFAFLEVCILGVLEQLDGAVTFFGGFLELVHKLLEVAHRW